MRLEQDDLNRLQDSESLSLFEFAKVLFKNVALLCEEALGVDQVKQCEEVSG